MPYVTLSGDDVQESLESIFSGVLIGGIDKDNIIYNEKREIFKKCLGQFRAKFNKNIFNDEYAFFYEILIRLNLRVFTQTQIDSLIYENSDEILGGGLVDISKYSYTIDDRQATDEEKVEAFRESVDEIFNRLSNIKVEYEEFDSSCEFYKTMYKSRLYEQTIQNMAIICSDTGLEVKEAGKRKKIYKGKEDADKYYRSCMEIIEALDNSVMNTGYVVDKEHYLEQKKSINRGIKKNLALTGIKEIDETTGYMKRGRLISVIGPTKGGKTKLSIYLAERLLKAGYNVAVWMLDGSSAEWEASHLSCYIKQTSNKSFSEEQILSSLEDSEEEDVKIKLTKEDRDFIDCARLSVACDPERGKLSFLNGVAYIETFIDDLKRHYEDENAYDVIIVDGIINFLSKRGMGKTERISEGYIRFKQYIQNEMVVPALGIVPAQLKQEVVDMLRSHPESTIDITAGGESAETIRSADEVWGLFSSKEERATGKNKLYSIASRHYENFDDFYCGCDLKCCDFWSDSTLNE